MESIGKECQNIKCLRNLVPCLIEKAGAVGYYAVTIIELTKEIAMMADDIKYCLLWLHNHKYIEVIPFNDIRHECRDYHRLIAIYLDVEKIRQAKF
jgi:hypothetical protein